MSDSKVFYDNVIYSEVDAAVGNEFTIDRNNCYSSRKYLEENTKRSADKKDSCKTVTALTVLVTIMIVLLLSVVEACIVLLRDFRIEVSNNLHSNRKFKNAAGR